MRRLIILFCVTVSLCHSVTIKIFASESSLTVAPAILEQVTAIDQIASTSAMITNTTDFPLPIKGQVSAFLSNNNLTKLESATFNAASWFTLTPADFILQPHQSKEIIIHILPNKGAEPGGHYATIYFEPLIPQGVLSPSSTISLARIGVLAFLIVPGDIHESLSLDMLTTSSFQSFGPISFDLKLKNLGNIHLMPTGKIEINNMFNQTVTTLPITSEIILPTTTSDKNLVWDKPLLFGRYTAVATINYGVDHDPLVSKPIIFWVIPWPLILILIMLLTLLYKIFIVHIDRVKLAIKILKGKDVQESQNLPQSTSQQSRSHRRTHTSRASSPRRKRR